MAENFGQNNLEAEIAELSRQLEIKRQELESGLGIEVDDREAVAATINEKFQAGSLPSAPTPVTSSSGSRSVAVKTHLEAVDDETSLEVNRLISGLPSVGLDKTIKIAIDTLEPYALDVFHDSLVDLLFEELKKHGFLPAK